MTKALNPMTEEEKRVLFLTVAPAEIHNQIDEWTHGPGVSFFIDDEWVGGMAFLSETNLLVGGMKAEHQYKGGWLDKWAEAMTWAHSIHTEIIMECANEDIADLFMKLGGKVKKTHETYWQVDFTKSYTEQFLQNNDLRSIG
jgi:hypothetical protein